MLMSKKERHKLYMREWYARNKEKVCAQRRAKPHDWPAEYQKRKAYLLAYMKAKYPEYQANRRLRLQTDSAYRALVNARGRAYRQTAPSILWRAELRARKKGIAFELTEDWLQPRLDAGKCELTGLQLTAKGVLAPLMPSIDRKDSSKGYTPDNCRVICWALNAAFNQWGEAEARKIWFEYLRRNP
jgi:hypothetical protein